MLKLEAVTKNALISGIEHGQVVRIFSSDLIGDDVISVAYESMLPPQPLRYVLADDPGVDKTTMAGLFIRELLMRADARRILLVSPGSLVDQWQDELFEKFGLTFAIFSRDLQQQTRSGNPFDDHDAPKSAISRSRAAPRAGPPSPLPETRYSTA